MSNAERQPSLSMLNQIKSRPFWPQEGNKIHQNIAQKSCKTFFKQQMFLPVTFF